MRRARVVLAVVLAAACLAGVASPASAAKKKTFCSYVRHHQFEFTQIFDSTTNPVIAAASSEQEVKRLTKVAPKGLKADFKTFRTLLVAIRTQNSDAISAAAPAAGPASKRILDYVKTKCGVDVPDVVLP